MSVSNSETLTNASAVLHQVFTDGLSTVSEYIYVSAISGSVSVIAYCCLMLLYLFPGLSRWRIFGLCLRLAVIAGTVNSFIAFLLMPQTALWLTIIIAICYCFFGLLALLSFSAQFMRLLITTWHLGFTAALKGKHLVRAKGDEIWSTACGCGDSGMEKDTVVLCIRQGKFYSGSAVVQLGGKFEAARSELAARPSRAAELKLTLEYWNGYSKQSLFYRGSAVSGKNAIFVFGVPTPA